MKRLIVTCIELLLFLMERIFRFIFKWSYTLCQVLFGCIMSLHNAVSIILNVFIVILGTIVSIIDRFEVNKLKRQRMMFNRSYIIFGKKFESGTILFRLLQVIVGAFDVVQDVFYFCFFTCLSLLTLPIKFMYRTLGYTFNLIKHMAQSFMQTSFNVYAIHYKYFAAILDVEIIDYDCIFFDTQATLMDLKVAQFSKVTSRYHAFSIWVTSGLNALQRWVKPLVEFFSGACFDRLQELIITIRNINTTHFGKLLGYLAAYFFLIPLSILFIDPKMYPNTYGESLPELVAPIFYTFYMTLIVIGCCSFVCKLGFKLFEGLGNMVFDLFTTKRFGSIAAGYGYVSSEHFNKTEVPGKFSPSARGSNESSEKNINKL